MPATGGVTYTNIMADLPEKYKVVGVAEPIYERREYIKNKHNVPCENCFDTWEKAFEKIWTPLTNVEILLLKN